jgi:hypothetical protein
MEFCTLLPFFVVLNNVTVLDQRYKNECSLSDNLIRVKYAEFNPIGDLGIVGCTLICWQQ